MVGRFVKDSQTKKIHVSELRIGMFVSKLDKDWLETPFLMQGFLIESLQDITEIEKYAEYVWIDAAEDQWVSNHQLQQHHKSSPRVRYINKVSAGSEHGQAFKVFKTAKRITKTLLDEARLGGAINTEAAKQTVNHCVDSILRNADALLWMAKLRNEDEYTAEHCLNVCILAIAFGRKLGMSEQDLHKIGICGLLHDVGKMRVPSEVLNKPGKLTEKEFKSIKAHVVHGRNLLLASPGGYEGAVDVAYSHHERVDGTGYPRKLSGASIPLFAKIIAIVDAFDAMTANRCYSGAMSSTHALKQIYEGRGKQFDERLALFFIKTVGLYPPGTLVRLGSGQLGLVLSTNSEAHHLPVVLVVKGSEGDILPQPKIIDLAAMQQSGNGADYVVKQVYCDGEEGVSVRDYREYIIQMGGV